MCALYSVTRSGYYAWRRRGESARRRQDRVFLDTIRDIFEQSRRTYGSPRIYRTLVASRVRVSRRRVERLMREAGLRARAAKLYRRNEVQGGVSHPHFWSARVWHRQGRSEIGALRKGAEAKRPFREITERALFVLILNHMHEHLGQSIAYARMNGVAPPWSEGGEPAPKKS